MFIDLQQSDKSIRLYRPQRFINLPKLAAIIIDALNPWKRARGTVSVSCCRSHVLLIQLIHIRLYHLLQQVLVTTVHLVDWSM